MTTVMERINVPAVLTLMKFEDNTPSKNIIKVLVQTVEILLVLLEKNLLCIQCNKGFGHESHLKRHMVTHTKETPFKCTVCGKGFHRNSHLKRHIIIHTGEKPFKCMHCGKDFGLKSTLKNHIVTHTGEAPYKCVQCNSHWRKKVQVHTVWERVWPKG